MYNKTKDTKKINKHRKIVKKTKHKKGGEKPKPNPKPYTFCRRNALYGGPVVSKSRSGLCTNPMETRFNCEYDLSDESRRNLYPEIRDELNAKLYTGECELYTPLDLKIDRIEDVPVAMAIGTVAAAAAVTNGAVTKAVETAKFIKNRTPLIGCNRHLEDVKKLIALIRILDRQMGSLMTLLPSAEEPKTQAKYEPKFTDKYFKDMGIDLPYTGPFSSWFSSDYSRFWNEELKFNDKFINKQFEAYRYVKDYLKTNIPNYITSDERYEKLIHEYDELIDDITNLEKDKVTLEKDKVTLETENGTLKETNRTVKKENNDLKNTNEILNSRSQKFEAKNIKLKKENKKCKNPNDSDED